MLQQEQAPQLSARAETKVSPLLSNSRCFPSSLQGGRYISQWQMSVQRYKMSTEACVLSGQAKLAGERGARAILFDITDDESAADQVQASLVLSAKPQCPCPLPKHAQLRTQRALGSLRRVLQAGCESWLCPSSSIHREGLFPFALPWCGQVSTQHKQDSSVGTAACCSSRGLSSWDTCWEVPAFPIPSQPCCTLKERWFIEFASQSHSHSAVLVVMLLQIQHWFRDLEG